MRRFPWAVVLLLSVSLTGCGGSHNDPGLSDPAPAASTDGITGTVTYQGTPLAGVTVTLWMTNTNRVVDNAVTDSSGAYSFTGIQATGNVPGEYHLWAMKAGYGFYPSVSGGARVTRADHTGQFLQSGPAAYPMYLDVIDYVALPDASLSGANFLAYDAKTPLVSVAATGQQTSYAAGDDGAAQQGVPWDATRFTDNQDGTVSDGLTGLTWLKDAGCLTPVKWAAALKEVSTLADGACQLSDGSAAGDWRMPNVVELESIVDASASGPAVPANSYFQNVSNGVYWTSTSYFGGDEGSPNVWTIRMSDGSYINDGTINAKATAVNAVWAVKGKGSGAGRLQASGLFVSSAGGDDGAMQAGVPLVYPRFVDNSDGTVTDLVTGLVWLKLANCTDIEGDWSHAVAAVHALASGQCGLTDGSTAGAWRMPNRKEVQSLADRNQNNEADYFDTTFRNQDQSVFQAAVFDHFVATQYYWTSTTDAADTTQAWTVYSCDFGVYAMSKSATGYALAVRQRMPSGPASRRSARRLR